MDQGRDPRLQQQKHPFPPNPTMPAYGHASFPPPVQNRTPFSSSPRPNSSSISFPDHNRRQSDHYYKQPRTYGQEAPPNHTRLQIGSTVNHVITPNLNNISASSSSQQHSIPVAHPNYGPPPIRTSSVRVAQNVKFAGTREHASKLPPIGSTRSGGMAIADLLGGPSSLESKNQYSTPVETPATIFSSSHPSPRTNSSRMDYPNYRRPQTPDHPRQPEARDSRINSLGSPAGLNCYPTPELQRFETPQQLRQPYIQRGIYHEERLDTVPKINSSAPPTRPSSQPISYNIPHSYELDRPPIHTTSLFNRRIEPTQQPLDKINYGAPDEIERYKPFTHLERDRALEVKTDREAIVQREREIEREQNDGRDRNRNRENSRSLQHERVHREKQEQRERERIDIEHHTQIDYQIQASQRKSWYSRPPEPQDWIKHGAYELPHPVYEKIPEREAFPPRRNSNSYEYPVSKVPPYMAQSTYVSNEHRYVPPVTLAPRNSSSIHEAMRHERQSAPQKQPMYNTLSHNSSHHSNEALNRKQPDEIQPFQQRGFLGAQEISRKERVSPLPQITQGATQTDTDGLTGEPSIKNEFGRMFSGIGSGVGSALQIPTPVNGPNYIINPSHRREGIESAQELQNICEPQRVISQSSKRRKILENEKCDDESPAGRITPSKRTKRTKTVYQK